MNGRIYDPAIGRFLSADPLIQAPYNSQSYNRYSYVWNNPLSNTDPSGFATNQGGNGCNGDECSNRAQFEMKKCERTGANCEFKKDGQGQWRAVGTTSSPVIAATAQRAGVNVRYVQPTSLAYAENGEPDNIRDTAIDTELGLEMEGGKLTGEIVWGCGKAQMAQCQEIVKHFDAMNAESEFLNITNSLVVDSESFEAHINFYKNITSSIGGWWHNGKKILWYNTAHGINQRISWHEYGHAIGLFHMENSSKNFMSYYGTGSYTEDVMYGISGHQQYWLRQAYTPWYGDIFE